MGLRWVLQLLVQTLLLQVQRVGVMLNKRRLLVVEMGEVTQTHHDRQSYRLIHSGPLLGATGLRADPVGEMVAAAAVAVETAEVLVLLALLALAVRAGAVGTHGYFGSGSYRPRRRSRSQRLRKRRSSCSGGIGCLLQLRPAMRIRRKR